MNKLSLPKRICFVTAHPDDEAFLAGGLIYKNFRLGGYNALFCATRGEAGKAYLDVEVSNEELGSMREKELLSLGSFLGIQKIVIATYPDKQVESFTKSLKAQIRHLLNKVKPELIISFGEDGYNGHRDHIAIGKITKEMAWKMKIRFIEFCAPSLPEIQEFIALIKRKNGICQNSVISKAPNICIKVSKNVKLEALKLYKTQFKGLDPYQNFSKDIAAHILECEYFYQEE